MTITLPYGTFTVHPEDTFIPQVEAEGFWDLELKPVFDRVQPRQHVVDVGAHVGLYSVYLAKERGCRVTAFEGHPIYFPLLKENIAQNPCAAALVTEVDRFLYSRWTYLREHQEHQTRASNTWLPTDEVSERTALTLDFVNVLDPVHLLKIDAQGADLHVLLGAEGLIKRDRPTILIEFEEPLAKLHGHTAEDYHRWAAEHQYREVVINGLNCWLEPI